MSIACRSVQPPTTITRHRTSRLGECLSRVLSISALVLTPAATHGDPVVFTNPAGPGHFTWSPPASGTSRFIRITLDAANQSEAYQPITAIPGDFRHGWSGASNTVIATGGPNAVQSAPSPANRQYTLPLDLGASIPSPSPAVFGINTFVHLSSTAVGDPEFTFVEGVPKYFGVRFDQGSGVQYGWIGVIRTGFFVDAFAWGYETTPGTSIAAGAGLGACCLDGICTFTNSAGCGTGTFTMGTTCEPSTCVTGACCIAGQCFILSGISACGNDGGIYQGDNTACAPDLCGVSATGACCNGTACSVSAPVVCMGTYQGDGSVCSADPLNPTTCCPANINAASGLSVQDIFDFLAAYFGNLPTGDFNGAGGVSVQDIFDFLAAYFAGC